MSVETASIRFIIGSRQLFAVPRRLASVSFSLDQLLAGGTMTLPETAAADTHGWRILSAPADRFKQIVASAPGHIVGGHQAYRRHFIAMRGSFDDYMAQFSGKTRSTLRRKRRKLEKHCSGRLEVREYRSPAEIAEFLHHALALSARTYQARLLDAGLPEGDAARAEMLALADADALRAYLLFADGVPVSYLYLPVDDGIIRYEYLGYDPALADFSPGTVLQLEALERLFAEQRYRYFDFTEGEGAHKALFGTGSIAACSFFLLKRDLGNRALLGALAAFDGAIGAAKAAVRLGGLDARLRAMLRG